MAVWPVARLGSRPRAAGIYERSKDLTESAIQILLVGAGRMGMRHLHGLLRVARSVVVVDPRAEALAEAEREATGTAGTVVCYRSLEEALDRSSPDAAVLGETAGGRLERVRAIVEHGVPALLVEKPLEQSRQRTRELAEAVAAADASAWSNHFFRGLDFFTALRAAGGPYAIVLSGGAYGLACNGIHWLDLAAFLAGNGGSVQLATIERTPIASGRGESFRDYGGRAVVSFPDGSTLFMSCTAASSAPMSAFITQRDRQSILLLNERRAIVYSRDAASDKPAYLYGADYAPVEVELYDADAMAFSTERWARAVTTGAAPEQPTVAESLAVHELLFDILEQTGESHFPIT